MVAVQTWGLEIMTIPGKFWVAVANLEEGRGKSFSLNLWPHPEMATIKENAISEKPPNRFIPTPNYPEL